MSILFCAIFYGVSFAIKKRRTYTKPRKYPAKNRRAEYSIEKNISINESIGFDKEGNEVALIDLLGSDDASAQEQIEQDEEREILRSKLPVLDEKERLVLTLRYGLDNNERITQREIAQRLGISRSYISRIEKKAVLKLKKAIAAEDGTHILR